MRLVAKRYSEMYELSAGIGYELNYTGPSTVSYIGDNLSKITVETYLVPGLFHPADAPQVIKIDPKAAPKGIKYDSGKPPMELLSSEALTQIAKVMGKGAEKYGAQNWRNGLEWSRVIGAALRHLTSFNNGEDLDPETGLSHLAHAGCCVMFLLEYIKTHPELDDRYRPNSGPNEPKSGAV
jgi:hypothetical protein